MDEKLKEEIEEEIIKELEEEDKVKKQKKRAKVKITPLDAREELGAKVNIDIAGPDEDAPGEMEGAAPGEEETEKTPGDSAGAQAEPAGAEAGTEEGAALPDPEKLLEELEALKDRDLRRQAEFENFRKRNEKEKAEQFDRGAANVLEKILPVIDNFERGFQSVEEEDMSDAFVDGMNKVYKQLMTELEKMGVTPIEAVGCEFDPNLHNAVQQVDTGEVESGYIAMELQKGYKYHDIVLRYSMVAVQA